MPRQSIAQEFRTIEPDDAVSIEIASNGNITPALDLKAERLHTIIMPAAWDAGGITFQVSADNTTWRDLYNSAGEYALTVAAASRALAVDQTLFKAYRYVKIRSGTSGTPVTQTAARALQLLTVPR